MWFHLIGNNLPYTITDAVKQDFETNIQSKYVQALLDVLKDCFSNVAELEAFSIVDPQKLSSEEKTWPIPF